MRGTNIVEGLENRRLMTGAVGGILRVDGTDGRDLIDVWLDGSDIMVRKNGQTIAFPAADVQGIVCFAGQGNDVVQILAGLPSTVRGGLGDDIIVTTVGDDVIYGGAGNDRIFAGEGDDVVYGRDGSDGIWGYGGNDSLMGQGKDDVIFAGTGDDTIMGGAGNDDLHGGRGNDRINYTGGVMLAMVQTSSFHDHVRGGLGNDTVAGGDQDTLLGCGGMDLFVQSGGTPAAENDYSAAEDVLLGPAVG